MKVLKPPNLDILVRQGKRSARTFVQQIAHRTARFMQGVVPVMSGALRFSVSYKGADVSGGGRPEAMPFTPEHSGLTAVVGVSTPYASYVEYGTGRMAGRYYARQAADHTRQLVANMKRGRKWVGSEGGLTG